jgi:phthalate 4,5-dioxygenase oxygenase subunit
MGPISDRSEEHLGTIDKAIIATRRLLLDAMTTVEAGGDPPGADDSYYRIRAIERVLPAGSEWWPEMQAEILEQRPVHIEEAVLATF